MTNRQFTAEQMNQLVLDYREQGYPQLLGPLCPKCHACLLDNSAPLYHDSCGFLLLNDRWNKRQAPFLEEGASGIVEMTQKLVHERLVSVNSAINEPVSDPIPLLPIAAKRSYNMGRVTIAHRRIGTSIVKSHVRSRFFSPKSLNLKRTTYMMCVHSQPSRRCLPYDGPRVARKALNSDNCLLKAPSQTCVTVTSHEMLIPFDELVSCQVGEIENHWPKVHESAAVSANDTHTSCGLGSPFQPVSSMEPTYDLASISLFLNEFEDLSSEKKSDLFPP